MIRRLVILLWMLFFSCTSTRKEVKQETREKRELQVLYHARSADAKSDYFINLRTGHFFDYHEGNELYPGTYSIQGKTLNLAFTDSRSPQDLTGKATIDTVKKEILLLSKNGSSNRQMVISPSK